MQTTPMTVSNAPNKKPVGHDSRIGRRTVLTAGAGLALGATGLVALGTRSAVAVDGEFSVSGESFESENIDGLSVEVDASGTWEYSASESADNVYIRLLAGDGEGSMSAIATDSLTTSASSGTGSFSFDSKNVLASDSLSEDMFLPEPGESESVTVYVGVELEVGGVGSDSMHDSATVSVTDSGNSLEVGIDGSAEMTVEES